MPNELKPPGPSVRSNADTKAFLRVVTRAMSHFVLTPTEKLEFRTLFGKSGATERLLASNRKVRLQSTALLIEQFSKLRAQASQHPNRRHWHVSFLGPIVTEYDPELDVDAYRQVIDRLLRSQRLNAIFSIELQALTNYPYDNKGRSFLVNAHALAWTDDPAFSAENAQAAMKCNSSLWSELGADTVRFTDRTIEPGQIEYLAHYLTKLPRYGKRRDKNFGGRLLPVGNVRADLQLRLMELLSCLEVTDLVSGVNDGKRLRAAWKKALKRWNDDRCSRRSQPLDTDFDTAELWRRVRSRKGNGTSLYREPKLFGPRPKPIASEVLPRHDDKRLRPGRAPPSPIVPNQVQSHDDLTSFISSLSTKTDLDD